jgi:MSHA type pilus biogenesis protein MshL
MRFRFHTIVMTALTAAYLSACAGTGGLLDTEKFDKIDKVKNLSRNDYKNIIKPDTSVGKDGEIIIDAKTKAPPIPDIAPLLAAPRPPKVGQTRLVSLAVTDDVPLKDVLIELARLADVDVEIDAGIKGGIGFRAKDRPFNEVIERIASLAGLRYNMKGGVLRIERDVPYIQNYSLDFLNVVRSSESSTSISTDVLALSNSAGGGEGGGSGISTGSSSSIKSSGEDDFWKSLEGGVKQILAFTPTSKLSEESEQSDDPSAPPKPAEAAKAGGEKDDSQMVINRRAGVLSVNATSKQHELIQAYLEKLEKSSSAQVLIEAKIVEVSLNDEFSSGIDWSAAKGNTTIGVAQAVQNSTSNLTTLALGDGNFGIDLNAAVKLTENFGTTRTLSSPRLHAINNQQAVLTFAENRVFFEVKVEKEDDQVVNGVVVPGTTTVESTRRSVPIGIILNIMPSINLTNNEITLSVRPTLSRQVDTVVDPGSALVNQLILKDNSTAQTFNNEVPIVEVRELDSILKIKNGQVMVIGGLMEETAGNDEKGVPGAGRVPWFGHLFKSVENTDKVKELIIFIRASIVSANGNYHAADEKLYNKFVNDPRPLSF